MKDLLGNKVKTGDILVEIGRGLRCFKGNDYKYALKIWEKPRDNDGSGYVYGMNGKKRTYYYASVRDSIKIDMSTMPEGFKYSFKHGMSDIYSKIKEGTVLELVENSDWKEHQITKEEVKQFKKSMNFKSKVIEGLTYGFVGSLGVNDGISHGVWSIDYDASVELPADYEEIAKREIFEYQHEQHLLEVKQRKDKFDMEKFGRTF